MRPKIIIDSHSHKLISFFLPSHFSRLKPKAIYYRNLKKFNEQKFLEYVKNTSLCFNSDDPNDNYELITDLSSKIINKRAPLKTKFLRGNQATFINKELRTAIYDRNRLRNRFCKTPTEENEKLFKKQRNKCVSIRKESIRNYFNKIANENIVTNRNFWKIIKPFLTNKGHLENAEIMLIQDKNIISNENELVKVFNKHYINIIEKSGGQKPTNIAKKNSIDNDRQAVELICNSYRNHPNILKIKSNNKTKGNINNNKIFSPVSSDEVRKLLQQLKPRKVIGNDKILPALINITAQPLSTPLSIAINNSFEQNIFPNNAKVACVKPLDKKTENKHSILNFRPVGILNAFSKIYEKFSKDFLISEIEMFLSPFLAAYRKSYNTQHVLIKIIEEWRENLDNFL